MTSNNVQVTASAVNPPHLQVEPRHSYVFVRQDLPPEAICVQSCHASLEAARHFLNKDDEHPHLVLIGVVDERRLENVKHYLESIQIPFVSFIEPDRNSELTSIATAPVDSCQRHLFRKYQLLKLKEKYV